MLNTKVEEKTVLVILLSICMNIYNYASENKFHFLNSSFYSFLLFFQNSMEIGIKESYIGLRYYLIF